MEKSSKTFIRILDVFFILLKIKVQVFSNEVLNKGYEQLIIFFNIVASFLNKLLLQKYSLILIRLMS